MRRGPPTVVDTRHVFTHNPVFNLVPAPVKKSRNREHCWYFEAKFLRLQPYLNWSLVSVVMCSKASDPGWKQKKTWKSPFSRLRHRLFLTNNIAPTDSHAAGYVFWTGTILSQKVPNCSAYWNNLSDIQSSTHLARISCKQIKVLLFNSYRIRDESDHSLNSKITSFERRFIYFTFTKEGNQQTSAIKLPVFFFSVILLRWYR